MQGYLWVVHIPHLFLQNGANLREFPASTTSRITPPGTRQSHEGLPQINALVRRENSPLCRRFFIIRGHAGGSAYIAPTPRQPPRPSRHSTPPNQGLLRARASRPPPRNRHRHNAMILVRAGDETRQDRETNKTANRTCYTERTLATRQRPLITSGTSKILFLGYSRCPILPPGTAHHRRRKMGRHRPANTQLRRDLMWWTEVPTQSNCKPIHKPIETAYLHTDTSGYGWGAVLNGRLEARG
jgi:hypothetical protein